jgi:hypothetical protein
MVSDVSVARMDEVSVSRMVDEVSLDTMVNEESTGWVVRNGGGGECGYLAYWVVRRKGWMR